MPICSEVLPFLGVTVVVFGMLALILHKKAYAWRRIAWTCGLATCICAGYFLYFFRDPVRQPPSEPNCVVAGADGTVAAITTVYEANHLETECVRVSIFLSLFDVHVNRAPISGTSTFLGYFPGKRLFTFQEKSSDVNQHNKILIEGEQTRCLVNQIVGPVCRRVVYWLPHDEPTQVAMGERIGMMKFGSRLDIYLPADSIDILTRPGEKVRAGETIIARIRRNQP